MFGHLANFCCYRVTKGKIRYLSFLAQEEQTITGGLLWCGWHARVCLGKVVWREDGGFCADRRDFVAWRPPLTRFFVSKAQHLSTCGPWSIPITLQGCLLNVQIPRTSRLTRAGNRHFSSPLSFLGPFKGENRHPCPFWQSPDYPVGKDDASVSRP